MMMINPQKLIALRKEARLSAAALAEKSRVGRATITRIENGKTARSSAHTVKQLAMALRCQPNDLANPPEIAKPFDLFSDRCHTSMKTSAKCQNALTLIALRYGESQESILELAPLLFDLFARESLRARSDSLAELAAHRVGISAMADRFPHLSYRFTCDWDAEEFEAREERSIRRNDLRGEYVHADENMNDTFYPDDYDDESDNPFVAHLRDRFAKLREEISDTVTIETWPRWRSPSYEIGSPEALDVSGGEQALAEAIISGIVRIEEIPSDLRKSDRMADRQAWMHKQVEDHQRRVSDRLAELGIDFSGTEA